MAVTYLPFLGIRVTDGEYQQPPERCKCEGNWRCDAETCPDTRPARSCCGQSIDPASCASLPGWGNNPKSDARKINGGHGQALTGSGGGCADGH